MKNAVHKVEEKQKAVIFGYYVDDPKRYGVVDFDEEGKVKALVEKPDNPPSNYGVVGLYFYPNDVIQLAEQVLPSDRGELEITDLNKLFLKQERLFLQKLGRGFAWLDTGTHESLTEATEFVKAVENRTGLKIACLEEIAWRKKWIKGEKILKDIEGQKGMYYKFVRNIIKSKI